MLIFRGPILGVQKCAKYIVDVFADNIFVASIVAPMTIREDAIQYAWSFVQTYYPDFRDSPLNFSVKEASKLNIKKCALEDQQKFIDQLRKSKDPATATKGYGYFIIWADGRGQVSYKRKQDAIDFINQNPDDDPYGMDVVSVKYREAEKGERVRNKFTEASARTYRLMKKAWDNPPRDEDHYPGSNMSGPMPHETPKSPGSKPRKDQRTIEDYHAPSQLDRDPIPGDSQPEQGTGGQAHSGDPEKVDNIYPEPLNWLRPLKGLPFTDEHLVHDFNVGFDTDYTQRQRGLNMRRVKQAILNMKKAQQQSKWANPEILGKVLYDYIKNVLQTYASKIQENPEVAEDLINGTIPALIEKDRDLYIKEGITLPIMLAAIKEAASLLIVQDGIALDTMWAEQAAAQYYPEGPRQQTSEISQMSAEESKLLNSYTADQIWDIARNVETENTSEGQIARSLIQKGIVADRLNMKKQSNYLLDEVNRIVTQWQQTAEVAGVEEVLKIFNDRTEAYNVVMRDLRKRYPENVAHTIAIEVIEVIPQLFQAQGSKLNMKKEADNPKYDNGSLQTSNVSETVIDAIKDIQKNIDKDKLYTGEDESDWVEDGKQKLFHITVLFGVDDDVNDKVKKVFDKYKPVRIETTGIEYFDSNPDFDVAIVKCKSAELTKIHNELKNALDNEDLYPVYNPHITIAYLKKGEKLDDNAQISNISWEIDSLDLSTSDGRLEKISALAVPIRESLDYPHSWNKKKKKKDKKIVTEKEKKILQMDAKDIPTKKASILDEPRASLDEAIWDIGRDDLPMLKPNIKMHIVENFLAYVSKFGGYIKPEQWVKNMFYTGSTATYTYSDASDIDIHIIVDWIDLAALNPDKARKDPKELWQELHDVFWWTLNKIKLPGTKHPLTYYVMPPGEEKKLVDQKEEIYDIGHDVWLIPPGKAVNLTEEVIDPALEEAGEFMARINQHIADARRGVIDYTLLQEVITPENAANRYIQIADKLREIDDDLKALKDEYALLKQKRTDAFEEGDSLVGGNSNYSLGNIIFKIVERYKYLDVLRKIKQITDGMDLRPDQVHEIANALGLDLEEE